ncbi:MAG: amino acid adenylation domain-containing protein [Pseudomonadales bacterium]
MHSTSDEGLKNMLTQPESGEVFRFPASFSQKAIWFIEQTNPAIRAYELMNGVAIRGALDTAAMAHAINTVTARHECLRCSFSDQGGELSQIVRSQACADITTIVAPTIDQAHEALDAFLDRRFKLSEELLFRALMITIKQPQEGEPDAFLVLKFHHIIVDQIAIATVVAELGELYAARLHAREANLSEQALDYADYAIWQQENVTRDSTLSKIGFWKDAFSEPVGCINLPLDHARGARQAFTGGELRRALRPGLSEAVRTFSQTNGVTAFTTLLSAYALTLSRFAGQDLIVVGVPFGNRGADEDLQDVVGLFINTLPIPINVDASLGFLEQVNRVKALFVTAQANQDVPVEFILEHIPIVRDPSYNPMFQVGFSFQPPPAIPALAGLECVDMELHPHASPFDIQMWILDNGPNQELGVQVWYDDAILEASSVEALVQAMETLLLSGMHQPSEPTSQISLVEGGNMILSGPELASQIQTIPALLDLANKPSDKTAVTIAGESTSYAQLHDLAAGVSRLLADQGIASGQRVGVLLERGTELLPVLLGALHSGVCYVPLDPQYPRDLLRYVAEDAKLAALVTSSGIAARFDGVFDMPQINIDEHWASLTGAALPESDVAPETPAYVIYTSGSTGKPKGVEIPHRAATNLIQTMLQKPGIAATDHLLAVTTLSFDISVLELYAPLVAGAQITVATHDEGRDIPALERLLHTSGATMMQATPSTWRLLVEQNFQPEQGFRALCGGEPLAPDLAEELLPRVAALWNLYGPTESTVWSSVCQVTTATAIRIGQPVANTRMYIFDESGLDVPTGVPGELYIGGQGLALGYVDRPELNAERFIEHPRISGERIYRTGDLVRLDGDGLIEHLGRLDHQIKIRGFRVELGHIESALSNCDGVGEAVVHSKEITAGDKRLIAYVTSSKGAAVTINDLRKSLRSELPEYMVPQFFVTLESIPRMANGKIDRAALPDPQELTRSTFEPPQGEAEVAVAAIWQELIGVKQIGRSDNFFAAGGHSLLAIKALAAIKEAIGVELDLRALTTRSLAELCKPEAQAGEPKAQAQASAPKPKSGLFRRVKKIFQG